MSAPTTNPAEIDPAGNPSAVSEEAGTLRKPRVDGAEAARLLAVARRSYAVAELVQERRAVGSVDSAVPAYRAFTQVFGLLLRLHGDDVPEDFPALAARAHAIASEQSLLGEDPSEDVALVDLMRRRVVDGAPDVTGPEDRRYDRAFVRSAEWFDGVESYLEELFPPRTTRRGRRAALALGALVLFGAGIWLGTYLRPDSTAVLALESTAASSVQAPGAPASSNPSPLLVPLLVPARILLTDAHVACSGCWRLEGSVDAPYAWTSGKTGFVVRGLPSSKAYHVELGIRDPGHVSVVRFRTPASARSEEAKIHDGVVASPVPVVSDEAGVLRWAVELVPWKPREFVKGSTDGRELGVAVSDVRIDEVTTETGASAPSASSR